jgi:glycosyltransferase involved in cell wall biosynthesis
MLVSAAVDSGLRADVAAGRRPTPEYLSLESSYGVELVDWSRLGIDSGHRSVGRSLRHVAASLRRARQVDVVFSDGEHVGIPLALAMQALRIDTPHVMIGHNLLTPAKKRLLRHLPLRAVDRVLVHSTNQVGSIVAATAMSADRLAVVPYGIDATFWSGPQDVVDDGLVVSAGREHRDYQTLVAALPRGARLTIADHSLFTPQATRRDPEVWPPTVERVALDAVGLRELYGRAAIVVVPVVESLMPAGITTLLEAMSMGKAVVVTETSELRGVIQDGESGLVVQPGDVAGMHAAIKHLLASPSTRHALGRRARQVVLERYDVKVYASALALHLAEAASRRDGVARHHRGTVRRAPALDPLRAT